MARDLIDRPTRAQRALSSCVRSLTAAMDALDVATARVGQETEESRRVRRELDEAIRLHAIFVAAVVHDEITSLAAIKGWAQLLQRRVWRVRTPEAAGIVELLINIDRTATAMANQLRGLEEELARFPAAATAAGEAVDGGNRSRSAE
jgi:signal transduction histidine kinase